jgi:hypothetical protein
MPLNTLLLQLARETLTKEASGVQSSAGDSGGASSNIGAVATPAVENKVNKEQSAYPLVTKTTNRLSPPIIKLAARPRLINRLSSL